MIASSIGPARGRGDARLLDLRDFPMPFFDQPSA